ncbi:nuclease-related domain-containing protein [Streptomyces cavernicola]|uniref:Nuclease-related domain-containing protein n=1 Tax=Streptomyces cavernicola TaxID=3043613 RepID=A0ABT6S8W2_9ACTN|nr:nuclease-related domain-containing protein [Streptomyces sp. B-S-A6]MDI3404541.1 nuclease-related domain-containing protein [Streptomyces sp. B-S-A6]
MAALRVVPTRRHGRELYHVLLPDGRNVAWYERATGRVHLLSEDRRQSVLDALAPYLTGPVTVGPPPLPTAAELAGLALHPDDDLAPNRPGEALLVDLDRDPAAPHRLRADPRRQGLAAEQAVGEALDRLDGAGWRTLHSVPLPGGARLHHLLIGPGGLYCLRSLYARKRRVRVEAPYVAVGRAEPQPLLRGLAHDAERASLALTVEVRPVLAVFEAARIDLARASREVRVVPAVELAALAAGGGLLKPADVDALYAQARDRHTWSRA